MKISVDAAHTMTRRLQLCFALKSRMSWRICSARSIFEVDCFTLSPWIAVAQRLSNAAGIGSIDFRKSAMGSMCSYRSSTPQRSAAS